MIEQKIIDSLKEKFADVHPLVFQRSLEHAKTAGELFDILDTLPDLPFTWDEKRHRWKTVKDVSLSSGFTRIYKESEQ
jgi:hypothetical protein